jgi:double-stranded uracil-DNA glycosylase
MRIQSFGAIIGEHSRVLILGSMPGVASLAAHEYYAHPQNQFWPIMGQLCGAGRALPYPERLQRLTGAGFALWDVLHSCVRPGSLDASIETASSIANDLPGLLRAHPAITRLCCNGGTAYTMLRRHFGPQLTREFPRLEVLRLPSTSPAAASWSRERKLAAWRATLCDRGTPRKRNRHDPADGSSTRSEARFGPGAHHRRAQGTGVARLDEPGAAEAVVYPGALANRGL